jgi:hypothetical protein
LRPGLVLAFSLVLLPIFTAAPQSKSSLAEMIGTWEGESKCTIPDSPCRDEHVIYEIALDKTTSGGLKMDAFKVLNGKRDFMGTLRCECDSVKKTLSCTSRGKSFDDWEYALAGDTLQGILTINSGKTLYRKINVKRASPAAR